MLDISVSFIGGGNMARSLIAGMLQSGWKAKNIHISEPNEQTATDLRKLDSQLDLCESGADAVEKGEVVIFAVKPQVLPSIVAGLSEALQKKQPMLVSIAAGITIGGLDESSGGGLPIVRCMPNTPAMVGSGATGLFANDRVSNSQKEIAESVLRAVGVTVWVNNEQQLDAVTALSGSGPAYHFLVMEAMQAAGEALGLEPETAQLLSLQTAFGAAKLALESPEDFATLRQHVTSPGGTTERAVQSLEANGIRELFNNAMAAAAQRSAELSQQD